MVRTALGVEAQSALRHFANPGREPGADTIIWIWPAVAIARADFEAVLRRLSLYPAMEKEIADMFRQVSRWQDLKGLWERLRGLASAKAVQSAQGAALLNEFVAASAKAQAACAALGDAAAQLQARIADLPCHLCWLCVSMAPLCTGCQCADGWSHDPTR